MNAAKILLLRQATQDPQNFFCSELVAEALKAVGILDDARVSASWWPRDFQDGGAIDKALNAAWLLETAREVDMESIRFIESETTTAAP